MNMQDWNILLELYHSKSITKASERLFISQPALTRRLHQIEEEFSSTILLRSARGISFTPQGERLVEYCRKMRDQYHQLQISMKTSASLSGSIHISASVSQTQFFLPGLLREFLVQHPGVSFELNSCMSSLSLRALNTRQTQIAFYRGDHTGNFLQKKLSVHSGYIICGYPFALEDLPEMPYISFESDHTSNSIRENWWYDQFTVPPYTAMTVKNANICYEMIRNGLGFGLFLNTEPWFQDQNLFYRQMFFNDHTPVLRTDYVACRAESLALEHIAAFFDFTEQYAKQHELHTPQPGVQNF